MKGSQPKERKNGKQCNLQKITGREAQNDSFGSAGAVAEHYYANNLEINNEERQRRQVKRIDSQHRLIALKMCQLIEPVIFWLNFTIERPDHLQYFKALWNTLTKLV